MPLAASTQGHKNPAGLPSRSLKVLKNPGHQCRDFFFIFSFKINDLVVLVSFEVDDVFERNGSFCQTKPHRGRFLVL